MPDKTWTMDLTKRDLKKLKFQKVVTGFLLSMMSLVVLMMVSFGIAFAFSDGDETAGLILTLGSVVMIFLTLKIRKHYRGLKADLKGGTKDAVQGVIQDRLRHRSNCDFTINGVTYHVNMDAYLEHKIGDQVLIAYAPSSKVMLDIQKVDGKEGDSQEIIS